MGHTLKIWNEFGIKCKTSFHAAGLDFFVPRLNGMTLDNVNNASSVFSGDIINSNGYNIPEGLSFLKPNISGTPTHVGGGGYDYSLPTKSFDFSTNWFNKGNK